MSKIILLVILAVGISIASFVVYSSDHFIENYSSGYPRSSEIPLYEGDSSPNEIPAYENDVEIIPINPNE